jgi:hypothetical protein
MRKRLVPLAGAAMMLVSTASADPFVDAVVRNFQDLGYEFIEIDRGRTQLRAEGVRGNEELTVIYDLATGRIIRQSTGRADDWYIGRSGIEINSRDRDFVGDSRSGRSRDDFDDDDDDDDDDDRSFSGSGRDDFDDDDDDDDRSFSGSDSGFGSGSGRDDNDDDNDDDDDDD